MVLYIGFSTIDRVTAPYTLTDIDLIKRDLLNEFHTRLGERVMQPEFGTIIFDLLMDPGDAITLNAIKSDAERIVQKEPRVQLLNVKVNEFDYAVEVELNLLFAPNKLTDSLYVTYQLGTGVPTGSTLLESQSIPGIQ